MPPRKKKSPARGTTDPVDHITGRERVILGVNDQRSPLITMRLLSLLVDSAIYMNEEMNAGLFLSLLTSFFEFNASYFSFQKLRLSDYVRRAPSLWSSFERGFNWINFSSKGQRT